MFINIRCEHCKHLLCKVSKDYFGVVQIWCRYCKTHRSVSIAMILRQLNDKPDILPASTSASVRA